LSFVDGRPQTLWIGLDYAAAKVSWEKQELTLAPADFVGVMTMEMAARDAMNGRSG
jgi:hypothetical protein